MKETDPRRGAVLVVGDAPRGQLTAGSLEVAAAGRALAETLGAPLTGGLIGKDVSGAAEAFLLAGMVELYVVDGARYEPFVGEDYAAAGEAILAACAPAVALFPHTLDTREWVSRLATRLRTGLVTDCIRLALDHEQIVMTKPVYGGSVVAECVVRGAPQMATMRSGAYEATTPGAVGRIVRIEARPPTAGRVRVLEETTEGGPAGPRLADARVVVAGGLGVGGPQHWHLVEEAAAALGGAVGATRAVSRRVPRRRFHEHVGTFDGREVRYQLADQGVRLRHGALRLRQVTRLRDDHQTPILTSRRDLPAVEVAYRMFERWRQENFFKYLREEFLLDALVDYQIEPDDPDREVPTPAWAATDAKLRESRAEIARLQQRYGAAALANPERARPTMRGFKIAHGQLAQTIRTATQRARALEHQRARIPRRIPVGQRTDGQVIKLATERKHLTNLLKMVAYQAESDLARAVASHYKRHEAEGRTLVQTALASAADLEVTDTDLRVTLAPLSSAHRTRAIAAVCQELNATTTLFPGTHLRLRYAVAEPG